MGVDPYPVRKFIGQLEMYNPSVIGGRPIRLLPLPELQWAGTRSSIVFLIGNEA